jgi:hypothetical protein
LLWPSFILVHIANRQIICSSVLPVGLLRPSHNFLGAELEAGQLSNEVNGGYLLGRAEKCPSHPIRRNSSICSVPQALARWTHTSLPLVIRTIVLVAGYMYVQRNAVLQK